MSTKLRITVTKEILERSKDCGAGDFIPTNCAISLAVRDVFPLAAVYGTGRLSFLGGSYDKLNNSNSVILSKEARSYVFKFDRTPSERRPFMPEFSFEISIPDEVLNEINIDELKPLLENHPTLELIEQ